MLLVVILGFAGIPLYFLVRTAYREGFYEGSVAAIYAIDDVDDPRPLHDRINARRKW